MHHTAHSPLVTKVYILWGAPMWAVWVFLLWRVDYCRWSGGCGWLLVKLIVRPCLVCRLPAAGGCSLVWKLLAVGLEWSQAYCQPTHGFG